MKRVLISCALMSVFGIAQAQTFFDDFNRADGGLGANYNSILAPAVNVISNQAGGTAAGNGMTLVDAGVFTGSYDTTTVEADVSTVQTGALAYCALILGNDGTTTASHGLFIKLQGTGGTGFTSIGFYTGSNSNTAAITVAGGNFQSLPSTVVSGHFTIKCTTLTNLYVGIDTDFNGVDDIAYNATLNFPTLVTGNRVGLHIYGTGGRIDNYKASTPVPEPATLASLALGALGLAVLRRRNRK